MYSLLSLLGEMLVPQMDVRLQLRTHVEDGQALTSPDASLDVVMSRIGAMSAPDQEAVGALPPGWARARDRFGAQRRPSPRPLDELAQILLRPHDDLPAGTPPVRSATAASRRRRAV